MRAEKSQKATPEKRKSKAKADLDEIQIDVAQVEKEMKDIEVEIDNEKDSVKKDTLQRPSLKLWKRRSPLYIGKRLERTEIISRHVALSIGGSQIVLGKSSSISRLT